jgi:hypothetical protein
MTSSTASAGAAASSSFTGKVQDIVFSSPSKTQTDIWGVEIKFADASTGHQAQLEFQVAASNIKPLKAIFSVGRMVSLPGVRPFEKCKSLLNLGNSGSSLYVAEASPEGEKVGKVAKIAIIPSPTL